MVKLEGCRGWLITLVTFFHFFANYGFLYSYGQFLVIFQDEFGKGATATGWLGTIPFGLTYLATPISNSLIARYQHRRIAAIGVISCFISLIVTSFMNSLLPMFFTFSLVYGFGINFVTASGLNIILQYFPDKNSARAVTMALIGCSTGLLALNPLIYFLINAVGWRNTVRIASSVILITGVGAVSTYTPPQKDTDQPKSYMKIEANKEKENLFGVKVDASDIALQKKVLDEGNKVPRALRVLGYPELWILASALVVSCAGVCFFYMSLVNFMISRKFEDETSALVMTVLGVSQVVGKVVVAIVGDHLPLPKVFLLVIANIIGAVQMGSLLVADTLAPVVCIIIISGVFVISVLDTIPHAVSHQLFHPNQCLISWTVLTSAMGSGYVVGALLGESMDQTGSYDCALYVCMGFFLTSALFCSFVPLYQTCCASKRIVIKNKAMVDQPTEL
ncbi:monocarboxylate transporter 9-like isoform X2 [Lytechinus variegatus]|nr:monocarboxylate transporter 9-like isoform X2 [Lytechinus variegatus]